MFLQQNYQIVLYHSKCIQTSMATSIQIQSNSYEIMLLHLNSDKRMPVFCLLIAINTFACYLPGYISVILVVNQSQWDSSLHSSLTPIYLYCDLMNFDKNSSPEISMWYSTKQRPRNIVLWYDALVAHMEWWWYKKRGIKCISDCVMHHHYSM